MVHQACKPDSQPWLSCQLTATLGKPTTSLDLISTAVSKAVGLNQSFPKVNYLVQWFGKLLLKKKKKKKMSQGSNKFEEYCKSHPQLAHRNIYISLLKALRDPGTQRPVWLCLTHLFLNSFDHEAFHSY